MTSTPAVLISAFSDEAAISKTAVEQFSVLAALGLRYYSPRFVDVAGGGTVKHVTELTDSELSKLKELQGTYGLSVTSIGSRLGKIKLYDRNDGSHNRYVALDQYLQTDVAATIRVAKALGTKLVRGFSFYHPKGEAPETHIDAAAASIRVLAEACGKEGLVYGLEVEANLVGQNGRLLQMLADKVNCENLVCIYDGGNISSQNLSPLVCYEEYLAMTQSLGWFHIKDYKVDPTLPWTGVVDEERLKNFVPVQQGDSGHEWILRDLATRLGELDSKMQALGAPGVFLELEPHLKGGGQFGGYSGPDGLGVALRSLCSLLDYVGIDYHLRDYGDIRTDRGF
jgi:sugar phosphate isomerase/epimerase